MDDLRKMLARKKNVDYNSKWCYIFSVTEKILFRHSEIDSAFL